MRRQFRFQRWTWFLIVFTLGVAVGYVKGNFQPQEEQTCTFCSQPIHEHSQEQVAAHFRCMAQWEAQIPYLADSVQSEHSRDELVKRVSAWQELLLRVDSERIENGACERKCEATVRYAEGLPDAAKYEGMTE